ncbi:helix-turn-helix domain-containing protein [Brevundimonas sp.]|uniref:helix-turn-helix domain-containing protein n=1 Tax=Brevundimonas sp. TaxID=1871086 RepID=UPI0019997C2F|nr:helix-turn-helix domain-containing protein [Brevundimonas sp.]MBD3837252.1 helix-turn-helix domain-containing protein [Brevundimonas sp.]
MLELRTLPAACAQRRSDAACASCGARAFSVCGRLGDEDLAKLDSIAERTALKAGEGLIRQGDPAGHVFNITSGSVRVYKLLPDGRRQITGFLFAGDFVGLATGEDYAFSAEAIEDATLCRFRKSDYRALIREAPALESALLERATHELAAAQNQMLLLGRKTALERVASFLLNLPEDPVRPATDGLVRLPMTRAEIADYLGLTIETVSRVFSRLKTTGVIRLVSLHELRIENPDRLAALAEGEG